MDIKLTFATDGSMAISIDREQGVDFEQAKTRIGALKSILGDVPIVWTGDVERHIHDGELHHVHTYNGLHSH